MMAKTKPNKTKISQFVINTFYVKFSAR